MPTVIGYARTSTIEQLAGFEDQKARLQAAGCNEIYAEQISSVAKDRPQFAALLAYARKGDVVVATKIDRLARNAVELLTFAQGLKDRGIGLRILDQNIDTTTPTGWLVLTIFGGIAEMERTQMLERQRIGIEKARLDKKYKGRKPVAADKVAEIKRLKADGRRPTDIARMIGVARSTVYEVLKASAAAGANFSTIADPTR